MSESSNVKQDKRGSAPAQSRRLEKRHRAERRFRLYGISAIVLALAILGVLIASIFTTGIGSFTRSVVTLEFDLDPVELGIEGTPNAEALRNADYGTLVKKQLRMRFPEVTDRKAKRELAQLLSVGAAYELRERLIEDPGLIGHRVSFDLPASDDADLYAKGRVSREVSQDDRKLSDRQLDWLDRLAADGALETRFNWNFLTSGDSREPELAGIGGAFVGTLLTLLVTLLLCFPLGVTAAIYLEEFAPKSRWTDLLEVNINNLAAVPSVIFGLLGLAIFLGVFNLPRSAPLVGGLVLAIRTLPIIIIAARSSLAAVPPSIRAAAMGIGASPVQVVAHHVLPSAMPGILTGTIIGMAQALGETAPLLMIGMVAFVVDVPTSIDSPATVLPVQIFLWADAPERAFVEKTSGAIMVLLGFLVAMNGSAVWMRQRFEQKN